MNWGKQAITCAVAVTLALGACPAFADDGTRGAAARGTQASVTAQDLAAGAVLADGTYAFESTTSSTGMITPNAEDGPATAVVKGGRVALVLDLYNPDKYDGLWAGKRSEAPADPYDSTVVNATMVPAGDYAGTTNLWTDADGLVGEAGATYKAARFVVAMGFSQFAETFANGAGGDFYLAVRRAPWSPSNPGKWMGSSDHHLTLSGMKRVSDSTDVPGGFPEDGTTEETALVRARRLIDAIPYDPYKVEPSDADAIHAAEAAYARLSTLEQQQLDAQEAANGVLTYGRSLQCASWGLDALTPVDDSTTLADGTYTTQVTSTCEMGKSNSVRGYKFTVAKVTVKGGRATATLEHATASPDTVSTGGVVYRHSNADEKAHSTFEVPVDLNSTFHFSQMAKNPTANTIAIPYEMTVAIDEANAAPDPEPAAESGEGGASTGGAGTTGEKNSAGAADTGKKPSGSSKSPAGGPSTRRQPETSSAALAAPSRSAPAASGATGSAGKAEAAPEDARDENARQRVSNAPAERPDAEGEAEALAAADVRQGDGSSAEANHLQAIALCAIALLAIGATAFSLDYLRRERKPVQVNGVRISHAKR